MKISTRYNANADVVLFEGDCLDLLKIIPDKSVDLVITSPPYSMGKAYENGFSLEDFKLTHMKVLPEVIRVVRDGGSICWQVGYHVNKRNGEITPLDYIILSLISDFSIITLRNRIIWTFGHGYHCSKRFSGRHEVVLWFTKGEKYYFDLDSVRVPQKYPGKRYYKGPNKGQYSGNPLGKNPSDIWDIPNVKARHPEKTEHPCQFPIALVQRLIKALCPPNGLVLDPFMGTGSTGAASIIESRKFVGSEIIPQYHALSLERIRKAIDGKLPYRPLDRPIYKPNRREAVAKKPTHFR